MPASSSITTDAVISCLETLAFNRFNISRGSAIALPCFIFWRCGKTVNDHRGFYLVLAVLRVNLLFSRCHCPNTRCRLPNILMMACCGPLLICCLTVFSVLCAIKQHIPSYHLGNCLSIVPVQPTNMYHW